MSNTTPKTTKGLQPDGPVEANIKRGKIEANSDYMIVNDTPGWNTKNPLPVNTVQAPVPISIGTFFFL